MRVESPRDAVESGLCLMTEDRKGQGLLLGMSCAQNITITDLAKISRYGLIERDEERDAATRLVTDLRIKTPSIDQLVRNFSGGNQQKVVIAKWLFRGSKVLICDEPTRGIDVGARAEIYDLLWTLAAEGKRRPVHLLRPARTDRHLPPHSRVRQGPGGRRGRARRVRPASHSVDGLRGIWDVSGLRRTEAPLPPPCFAGGRPSPTRVSRRARGRSPKRAFGERPAFLPRVEQRRNRSVRRGRWRGYAPSEHAG